MTTQSSKAAGRKVTTKQGEILARKAKGVAAKQARKDAPQVTSAGEWKKSGAGFPLTVPSGNVALVRPVGMQAFLAKGIIPNSLREIAMEAITKRKAPELKIEALTEQQILDMIEVFDGVTVYCVIEPKVTSVPQFSSEDAREGLCSEEEIGEKVPQEIRDGSHYMELHGIEESPLYVDEVDLDDKMFIFQFACGGTRNVEQFRTEYSSGMEQLSGE